MKKTIVFATLLTFISISTFALQKETTASNCPSTCVAQSDSLEYKDYYGSYKMADNPYVPKMKVYFKAGELYGQAADYPETKLIKKKDDEFEEGNFGAQIIFVRTGGLISGVKVIVQGQELIGTKE